MERHTALDLADEVQAHLERGRKMFFLSSEMVTQIKENPSGLERKDLIASIRTVMSQQAAYLMVNEDLFPEVQNELQAMVERLEEMERGVDHELAWAYTNLRYANWSKWGYAIVGFVIGISIGAGFVYFAV